jgi:hypothetical protein
MQQPRDDFDDNIQTAEQLTDMTRRIRRDCDEIGAILKDLVPDAERIAGAVHRLQRLADDPSLAQRWRDEINATLKEDLVDNIPDPDTLVEVTRRLQSWRDKLNAIVGECLAEYNSPGRTQ